MVWGTENVPYSRAETYVGTHTTCNKLGGYTLVQVVAVTFFSSLLSPLLLIPLLRKLEIFDHPNQRSSHNSLALRGLGTAPLLATLIAAVLIPVLDFMPQESVISAITIIGFGAMTAVVGLVDDVRNLSVKTRLYAQALLGILGGITLTIISDAAWIVLVPLTTVALLVLSNVTNFMDGVDSITGVHGVIFGTFFALIGMQGKATGVLASGLIIAAAFFAILPWNVFGRGMFLGDVGSYLLGGASAFLAAAAAAEGVPLWISVAPFIIYIADTFATLARRVTRGANWRDGHREHVYQRLADIGLSHLTVGLFVSLFSAVSALMGMLVYSGLVSPAIFVSVEFALVISYLFLPRMVRAARRG